MTTLHVLYDGECPLCQRCRAWLAAQSAYFTLRFTPYQQAVFDRRFQGVDSLRPDQEMLVISDTGDIWQGAHAWIMCLWALREYRPWALRLSRPGLQPLARKIVAALSKNRRRLSIWLPTPANPCGGRCLLD